MQVSTSMKDLCHDVFGVAKERKDPREVKGNRGNSSTQFILRGFLMFYLLRVAGICRFYLNIVHNFYLPHLVYAFRFLIALFSPMSAELLDVLPEKRKFEEGGYLSDDDAEVQ